MRGAAVTAEWKALSLAVNALLQRAAALQGMINQHEFLPADDDAQRIEDALLDLVMLSEAAIMRYAQWLEVQP